MKMELGKFYSNFILLLSILLIGLKLSDIISWNWLWVTFPLWGNILCSAIFTLIVLITLIVKHFLSNKNSGKY